MAAGTPQGAGKLLGWRRLTRFESGLGLQLPNAYKKFWEEWREREPKPVHYIPKPGRFERNALGEVKPIQNVKIPLKFVPDEHDGIWGGEAIVKGFQKRSDYKRRVPHYWVPTLKRSVVHSEILNEFFSMTVTERTIRLILEHQGFDHYLLKTAAVDLRSLLAMKLKQKMLKSLLDGCPQWADNSKRQNEVKKTYGIYLKQYTAEEIEWYGLTYEEAIKKIDGMIKAENPILPHKAIFRSKLVEQLRQAGVEEAQGGITGASEPSSWVKKINPFAKKEA